MPIREATRLASEHDTHIQRASSYHRHRVDDIRNGEHDLDSHPHAVVHAIPEGSLEDDWHESKIDQLQTHRLHAFTKELTATEPRPTGRRAFENEANDHASYGHLATTGVYEIASRRFIHPADDTPHNGEYTGDELEAATTAFVYWLNNQYSTVDLDDYTLHITLMDMDDVQLVNSDDPPQTGSPDDDAVFETDTVQPFPIKPDTTTSNATNVYNDLRPLFDRLWSAAGLFDSPYNTRDRTMGNAAEAYRL